MISSDDFSEALQRIFGDQAPAQAHSLLKQLWKEGRAAWPDIALDAHRFALHVRPLLEEETPPPNLRGADLYLACGCAHGEAHAIRYFESKVLHEVVRGLPRIAK